MAYSIAVILTLGGLFIYADDNRNKAAFYLILAALLFFGIGYATARDFGQWDRSSPESQWYSTLMQPDNPAVSCCGEADAWYTGFPYARGDKMYIRIDDDRPDEPRKRRHIDSGTEFEVPFHKIKKDQGNPTGHGVIFLSTGDYVYCYVMPGGV